LIDDLQGDSVLTIQAVPQRSAVPSSPSLAADEATSHAGSREWQSHRGEFLDRKNGFDVINCQTCGFAHVVPLPSVEELEEVYRENYYQSEKPCYLAYAREDETWHQMSFGDRYALFEGLLRADRRRILDVGTGPGFFLATGRDRGWTAQGMEPSRQAACHARELGLDIVEGFLSRETVTRLGEYDVVHMSEVLEHVPDPAEIVRLARSVLAPSGLICISVPNDYNPFQDVLDKADGFPHWWVQPPHHLNYFNFATLSGLLERQGFEVVGKDTNFPMELFLLMGDNYVGNDATGRTLHAKRKRFDLAFVRAGRDDARRALYRALAQAGLGRLAIVTARKRD
jgi:2-polyprenyl-3-methyl-5-hydroxy-6-metoxy-1,4-benzoquinol methylase